MIRINEGGEAQVYDCPRLHRINVLSFGHGLPADKLLTAATLLIHEERKVLTLMQLAWAAALTNLTC